MTVLAAVVAVATLMLLDVPALRLLAACAVVFALVLGLVAAD